MRFEVRIMNCVGYGEYRSVLVKAFCTYEEADEYNRRCHEDGFNTYIEEVR